MNITTAQKTKYYTYIVNPEKVLNYSKEHFKNSRFLFEDSKNFTSTPKATRNRYNRFLDKLQNSISPLIESSYLSDINQTRIMFNSDFELPQLPIFRKLLEEYNLILKRAYWNRTMPINRHHHQSALYTLMEKLKKIVKR